MDHCVHMIVCLRNLKKKTQSTQIPEEDKSTLGEILSAAVVPWWDPFPANNKTSLSLKIQGMHALNV